MRLILCTYGLMHPRKHAHVLYRLNYCDCELAGLFVDIRSVYDCLSRTKLFVTDYRRYVQLFCWCCCFVIRVLFSFLSSSDSGYTSYSHFEDFNLANSLQARNHNTYIIYNNDKMQLSLTERRDAAYSDRLQLHYRYIKFHRN